MILQTLPVQVKRIIALDENARRYVLYSKVRMSIIMVTGLCGYVETLLHDGVQCDILPDSRLTDHLIRCSFGSVTSHTVLVFSFGDLGYHSHKAVIGGPG